MIHHGASPRIHRFPSHFTLSRRMMHEHIQGSILTSAAKTRRNCNPFPRINKSTTSDREIARKMAIDSTLPPEFPPFISTYHQRLARPHIYICITHTLNIYTRRVSRPSVEPPTVRARKRGRQVIDWTRRRRVVRSQIREPPGQT